MALSNECKNYILKELTGKNQTGYTSNCYIGLATSIEGGFVEPSSDAGYSRTLIGDAMSSASQKMSDPSSGTTVNDEIIFFPESTDSWGTITHFGLFKSATADSPYLTGELTASVAVPANYVPIFRVNALSISIS